jgi:hypothetical protein
LEASLAEYEGLSERQGKFLRKKEVEAKEKEPG